MRKKEKVKDTMKEKNEERKEAKYVGNNERKAESRKEE